MKTRNRRREAIIRYSILEKHSMKRKATKIKGTQWVSVLTNHGQEQKEPKTWSPEQANKEAKQSSYSNKWQQQPTQKRWQHP